MRRFALVFAFGLLAATCSASAADLPVYRSGVLTIPVAATDEHPGQYQNVVMELDADGRWRLNSMTAMNGDPGLLLLPLQTVEVVRTGTSPVQVFLRLSGYLTSGCSGIGRFVARREGARFDAALFDTQVTSSEIDYACTMSVTWFVKSFPLDVYGLAAGSYSYSVNGISGSFELEADNVLSGDCVGSACY